MPSIAQLEKLLQADPNDVFVLYALAQEHAKAGDYPRAIAFYDRVLAIDPGYCYAYFHKARVQEVSGDVPAAIATLQQGVAKARAIGDAKALNELASALDILT
jgi:tetratricopeptide (TPR) repeat protein